ncbi:hypothetical protein HK096_005332, partial [Nowakowskiella sp. JEL0078]
MGIIVEENIENIENLYFADVISDQTKSTYSQPEIDEISTSLIQKQKNRRESNDTINRKSSHDSIMSYSSETTSLSTLSTSKSELTTPRMRRSSKLPEAKSRKGQHDTRNISQSPNLSKISSPGSPKLSSNTSMRKLSSHGVSLAPPTKITTRRTSSTSSTSSRTANASSKTTSSASKPVNSGSKTTTPSSTSQPKSDDKTTAFR